MVEGFTNQPPERLGKTRGKPVNPPSMHLRNLAWLRFLLDNLPQVRQWALGQSEPPPAWQGRRRADAEKLRFVFAQGNAPAIPEENRSVLLLDHIFDDVLHGKHGQIGRWFSNKIARGIVRPDEQRLKWLDDLVPGSAAAFHDVRPSMDPWFYNALDFISPWYGRLHLWRTIDPSQEDPAWDEVWDASGIDRAPEKMPAWAHTRRDLNWRVTSSDIDAFHAEIALALAHVLFPEQLDDPNGLASPGQAVDAAVAASSGQPIDAHPLVLRMRHWSEPQQWPALSDALAALRLVRLIGADERVARWWVAGAMEATIGAIQRRQLQWFCALPHQAPPLEGFIATLMWVRAPL